MKSIGGRHESGGVLLVGNLPEGPLVGGVEVGVKMLLDSILPAKHGMRLFNTARRRDSSRPLGQRLLYQLGCIRRFTATIIEMRPRIVHVKVSVGINFWQGACYTLVGRLSRRRVLQQLHGGGLDSWYREHGPLGRWAMRVALRIPSEILVLSNYWAGFIRELHPRARIRVMPNGVQVCNALARQQHKDGELLVLTLGSLGKRKGHFEILAAASQLNDLSIRFVFAGTDEFRGERETLESQASALGVSDIVQFVGAADSVEKWKLLAKADIFLLPSQGENMPNAILEAMAAGAPIICTPVGAIREMVDEGAIFVPVGDGAAIATAIRKLADSADSRRAMGEANRVRVSSVSIFPSWHSSSTRSTWKPRFPLDHQNSVFQICASSNRTPSATKKDLNCPCEAGPLAPGLSLMQTPGRYARLR